MARSVSIVLAMAAFLAFWVTLLGAEVRAQQGTVNVVVDARVWDAAQGRFRPQTPPGRSDFTVTSAGGGVVATVADGEAASLVPGGYTLAEVSPSAIVFDFLVSPAGASSCPENPAGGPATLTLTAADFPASGTLHLCVYHKALTGGVVKELESADSTAGTVTWRIRPSDGQQYLVWDSAAESCQSFNGATCGGIGAGGTTAGTFVAATANQYLLVTQTFDPAGTCAVQNTVEWTAAPFGPAPVTAERSMTVSYTCSGASVLGWRLLIPLFVLGIAFAFIGYQRIRR